MGCRAGLTALPRAFYLRPAVEVAPALLGKLLVHRTPEGAAAGMIVETEAYAGPYDKGAHSYGGRPTPRTAIQYGPGGYAYVFGIYGMYWCFNAVTGGPDQPEVVLIRALAPVEGLPLMVRRRGTEDPVALCNGPGKLCAALGITKAQYGADLCGGTLFIAPWREIPDGAIMTSPRINIDYAQEYRDVPWRYFLPGEAGVSRVPRRYRQSQRPYAPALDRALTGDV